MVIESFQCEDTLSVGTTYTDSGPKLVDEQLTKEQDENKMANDNENDCPQPREAYLSPNMDISDTSFDEGGRSDDSSDNEIYQTPRSHRSLSNHSSTLSDLFRRIGPIRHGNGSSRTDEKSCDTADIYLPVSTSLKTINTSHDHQSEMKDKIVDAPSIPSSIESTVLSSVHRILPPMFTPIRSIQKTKESITVPIVMRPIRFGSTLSPLSQQEQSVTNLKCDRKRLNFEPPQLFRKSLDNDVIFLEDDTCSNPLPILPMDIHSPTRSPDTSKKMLHRKLKMRRTSTFSF